MEKQVPVPALSISESLSRSWKAVSKNIWLMAGFTLLYYIAMAIVAFIPFVNLITNLFSFIFAACLFSAFYKIEQGGELSFNDFFSWGPRFSKMFTTYLVVILIAIVMVVALTIFFVITVGLSFFTEIFSGVAPELSSTTIGMLIGLLLLSFVLFFIFFLFTFAVMYLAQFRDLNLSETLSLSWKIGKRNAGQLFLFILLSLLVSILGVLALLVGLLVAVPVIVGMQYYFLRSMFPEEQQQQPEWDFMKQNP